MYCWISGMRVAASRCVTSTRKAFPLTLSIPPKTQCPSCQRPRLYFLLPNFDSSISTSTPGPPIMTGCLWRYSAHTSLIKLYQSTAVFCEIYSREMSMYTWLYNVATCIYLYCTIPLHVHPVLSSFYLAVSLSTTGVLGKWSFPGVGLSFQRRCLYGRMSPFDIPSVDIWSILPLGIWAVWQYDSHSHIHSHVMSVTVTSPCTISLTIACCSRHGICLHRSSLLS